MVIAHFNNKLTIYAIRKYALFESLQSKALSLLEDLSKELVCEKADADEPVRPKYLIALPCKDIQSGESDM
jgi:hypothetical protein